MCCELVYRCLGIPIEEACIGVSLPNNCGKKGVANTTHCEMAHWQNHEAQTTLAVDSEFEIERRAIVKGN